MEKLPYKDGIFKAANTMIHETSINDKVLRIHLSQIDFTEIRDCSRGKSARMKARNEEIKDLKIILSKLNNKRNGRLKTRPKATETHRDYTYRRKQNINKTMNGYEPEELINFVPIDDEPTYQFVCKSVSNLINSQLLCYTFETLTEDMKFIQLPTSEWKIRAYTKNQLILSVSFTNFLIPERSLTFNHHRKDYDLVMDGRDAILLGQPRYINSKSDLQILLNIVHNINSKNEMIYYKSVKKK